MHRRLSRALVVPAAAAVLLASSVPAAAQTVPTTPVPDPANPGQAPVSVPPNPQPTGRAVGEAGTALGILRLLPESVPTSAILPGAEDDIPRQSAAEAGFGLSSAQANSEAYLAWEQSIAQSSPFGLAVGGNAPQTPGSLVQTAPPDNAEPATTGFAAPDNPLLNVRALEGSAHARWSEKLGPCVGTIADASTSVGSFSVLDNLPTMPSLGQLTANRQLQAGLESLPGPLSSLGGLLTGGATPAADGSGSVLSMPKTLMSRSFVRLVDMKGTDRKAVQSVSTLKVSDIHLLKGTPLSLTLKVVSQPTLTVTSTGDAKTSSVRYTAPVLSVVRNGQELFKLDAANPTKDVPIGIPLPGFEEAAGANVADAPIIGGAAELTDGSLRPLSELTKLAQERVLDIGVLRLSIAGLDQKSTDVKQPFKGHQVGASARMLDVRILPTEALRDALPANLRQNMPSSLAQVSLGEQVARALAPHGGVKCGFVTQPKPKAPPAGGAQPGVPDKLAETNAYESVPLFWTGTAMLLLGVVMVAGLPTRRRPAPALEGPDDTEGEGDGERKPSPHPRS